MRIEVHRTEFVGFVFVFFDVLSSSPIPEKKKDDPPPVLPRMLFWPSSHYGGMKVVAADGLHYCMYLFR